MTAEAGPVPMQEKAARRVTSCSVTMPVRRPSPSTIRAELAFPAVMRPTTSAIPVSAPSTTGAGRRVLATVCEKILICDCMALNTKSRGAYFPKR